MRYHRIPNPSYYDIEIDIKDEIRFRKAAVLSRLEEHKMKLVRSIKLRKADLTIRMAKKLEKYKARSALDPLSELLAEFDSNLLVAEKNMELDKSRMIESLDIRKRELSEELKDYLIHLPTRINAHSTDITDKLAKEVADGVKFRLQVELQAYEEELAANLKIYKEEIAYEVDSFMLHMVTEVRLCKLELEAWLNLPNDPINNINKLKVDKTKLEVDIRIRKAELAMGLITKLVVDISTNLTDIRSELGIEQPY